MLALKIMGHLFTGPLNLEKTVIRTNHPPAVFVILSKEEPRWDPAFRFIDAGFSGEGNLVFATHEKRTEWERRCTGELSLYTLDMDEAAGYAPEDRMTICEQIMARFAPPNELVKITQ